MCSAQVPKHTSCQGQNDRDQLRFLEKNGRSKEVKMPHHKRSW